MTLNRRSFLMQASAMLPLVGLTLKKKESDKLPGCIVIDDPGCSSYEAVSSENNNSWFLVVTKNRCMSYALDFWWNGDASGKEFLIHKQDTRSFQIQTFYTPLKRHINESVTFYLIAKHGMIWGWRGTLRHVIDRDQPSRTILVFDDVKLFYGI